MPAYAKILPSLRWYWVGPSGITVVQAWVLVATPLARQQARVCNVR